MSLRETPVYWLPSPLAILLSVFLQEVSSTAFLREKKRIQKMK